MNEICPTEALSVLLNTAFQKRKDLFSDPDTDAFRMFNGFCEGFPSFSIDRYAGTAVILWTDKKAVPGSGLFRVLPGQRSAAPVAAEQRRREAGAELLRLHRQSRRCLTRGRSPFRHPDRPQP